METVYLAMAFRLAVSLVIPFVRVGFAWPIVAVFRLVSTPSSAAFGKARPFLEEVSLPQ